MHALRTILLVIVIITSAKYGCSCVEVNAIISGAPNDLIFANTSHVSQMVVCICSLFICQTDNTTIKKIQKWRKYGGLQRQYTNIYYITAFCILVHKHIHWLCEYIYQYNKIYTSTTICIPAQKC